VQYNLTSSCIGFTLEHLKSCGHNGDQGISHVKQLFSFPVWHWSLILLMWAILDNWLLRSCFSPIVFSGLMFIVDGHCYCTSASRLWRLKHAIVISTPWLWK